MMNRIAFVFTHGPHGNATAREGLDALLATSAICEEIGVFFIADGVLLLLAHQHPEWILARNFIATFGVLSLHNIDRLYLCADSAKERGLKVSSDWELDIKWLPAEKWRQRLAFYDILITF